jgi:transposase
VKGAVTMKLYSAKEIAQEIGVTKDTIHKWKREKRIPQPKFYIGNVEGWTEKQVNQIKEKELSK